MDGARATPRCPPADRRRMCSACRSSSFASAAAISSAVSGPGLGDAGRHGDVQPAPSSAASRVAGSVCVPATTPAPAASRSTARYGSRLSAETLRPCRSSSATTCRPVFPVAPVTSIDDEFLRARR
ncbi:hypothetical protein NFA_50040 [Nocardia farcinica IFM 10152]|uniref:Uncharacterized protein n=1 Tax=Nocardia farcinica (strain IFM 10152) TaxID=247156 RepID=Q5YPN5_NOCFA|nr:hypothetical protein NFA_50040 [Nocardia farcinica IFM 10152]